MNLKCVNFFSFNWPNSLCTFSSLYSGNFGTCDGICKRYVCPSAKAHLDSSAKYG